ncbi:MAG: transcription-repair coupling factor [Gammaproteobacteria bacterium]|nr:transcription-repair coupling factor [Gammaproteobacteria bacterium]
MPALKELTANTQLIPDNVGQIKHWRGLHSAASSYAISALADNNGPLLLVCSSPQQMSVVLDELQFFCGDSVPVIAFPDWECLPYDRVSPHPDLISQRLLAMHKLPNLQRGVVVTTISTLQQRLAPTDYTAGHTFELAVNQEIDLDAFRQRLSDGGYYSVDQVMAPGEFAIRGGLIDVFPAGSDSPFRLDLFDTQIETIRLFDPDTQLSTDHLQQIRLLPAREFPHDSAAIELFRQSFRATLDGNPRTATVYREVSQGIIPTGTEFYLPLFFSDTATLFDYLPADCVVLLEDGAKEMASQLDQEITERYDNAQLNPEWPPLSPELLFLRADQINHRLKQFRQVQLLQLNLAAHRHVVDFDCAPAATFNLNLRDEQPYAGFIEQLRTAQQRTLLVAESAGRRESVLGLLKQAGLTCNVFNNWAEFVSSASNIGLCVADLDRGMCLPGAGLQIICESQLYGERSVRQRRRSTKNRDPDAIIRSLAELNLGDPVVHEEHGVGRYRGLETLHIDGNDNEYATVEYHGGDKIYIPVLSLDLVSRYVGGSPDTAPLHKMGGDTWLKLRNKAKEKAYDVAAELLEVQALRLARIGHAFPPVDHSYDAFAAGFELEETPDQQQVIDDVINDMMLAKPMDRLVCGDVGFGKTEIALRAAYMAIAGSKQVVVLVPTTLLAQQHYDSFADRFADWPVTVELFSRFRSAKQIDQALEGIKNGTVDIAVGTHKLIQRGINFRDLGLMIIDEEHRFGVRQKEQLKKLRSQVDILTLTATPIPRTLNFALSGLRDISVIATPPRARLSVKTFVREWDDGLLREALIREIRRGGQVYFLHNEVQTIDKMQARIEQLLPEAKVRIGHGQMRERELESVMRDFYHQRFNVLLCTTIIESGIDVPTANTIIINRADRFGLAQLHQLRGRVGRSHHQAYAYMLTPSLNAMTEEARKRLLAIESLNTLGAGFALASQDLEIRGAGELLGESQSGMIDSVGYSLYSSYLDQAIADIQSQRRRKRGEVSAAPKASRKVDINLHIPARFPDAYIPDVTLRLNMYKRITACHTQEQLKELQIETIDRFGLLPDSAKNLFAIAQIKLQAAELDVLEIELGPSGGLIRFAANPDINIDRLMREVAANPNRLKFNSAESIRINQQSEDAESRLLLVRELLVLVAHD